MLDMHYRLVVNSKAKFSFEVIAAKLYLPKLEKNIFLSIRACNGCKNYYSLKDTLLAGEADKILKWR